MRSIECEGDRVGTLQSRGVKNAVCRPDHPHFRALRGLNLSRAQRGRGC
jgi:hypothetical protein